jgi:hypothetical protein
MYIVYHVFLRFISYLVQSFEQGEICTLKSEDSGLVGQIFPDISVDHIALEMLGTAFTQ